MAAMAAMLTPSILSALLTQIEELPDITLLFYMISGLYRANENDKFETLVKNR